MLLHNASAIALPVCNGVGGCLCTIFPNTILMYIASRAMTYSAARSASVVDVMTCLIMWEMLIIAPLFSGIVDSLYKKKSPPAQLLDFGYLR